MYKVDTILPHPKKCKKKEDTVIVTCTSGYEPRVKNAQDMAADVVS
jgi:hypothetical protein